jgi:microcystin-dependent protein
VGTTKTGTDPILSVRKGYFGETVLLDVTGDGDVILRSDVETTPGSGVFATRTVKNVKTPASNYDAANKKYVDDAALGGVEAARVPAGAVMSFAGNSAPDGWLLCCGQLVNKVDYEDLYAAIGTTYGGTAGVSFRVPDLRARIPVGNSNVAGGSVPALGNDQNGLPLTVRATAAKGGREGVQLAVEDIAPHRHYAVSRYVGPGGGLNDAGNETGGYDSLQWGGYAGGNGTGWNDPRSARYHDNMQPYLVMHYIIKT